LWSCGRHVIPLAISGLLSHHLSTASFNHSQPGCLNMTIFQLLRKLCHGYASRGLPIVVCMPHPYWGVVRATTTNFPSPFNAPQDFLFPGADPVVIRYKDHRSFFSTPLTLAPRFCSVLLAAPAFVLFLTPLPGSSCRVCLFPDGIPRPRFPVLTGQEAAYPSVLFTMRFFYPYW